MGQSSAAARFAEPNSNTVARMTTANHVSRWTVMIHSLFRQPLREAVARSPQFAVSWHFATPSRTRSFNPACGAAWHRVIIRAAPPNGFAVELFDVCLPR